MGIEFIIDQQYDTKTLWQIFKRGDPAGLESRAKSMEFDLALAREINQSDSEKVKEKVNQLVEDEYRRKP